MLSTSSAIVPNMTSPWITSDKKNHKSAERRDESEKVRFAIPKKHDGAFRPARDGKVRDAAKSDNAE